jgi:hypothetical protein
MSGVYPHFNVSYSHDELVEHFLLTPADLQLVLACRGEVNRCGMALLLKALTYLGYVLDGLEGIPDEVRAFVAGQLGLLWDYSHRYPEHRRTWDQHLFLIRQHTGWRVPTAQDKAQLEQWLRREAAFEAHSAERLWESACQRLQHLRIELPAEGELQRLVNAALNGFFQDIHHRIAEAIAPDVRRRMDQLLVVRESRVVSGFEDLKADPGKAGVEHFQAEIDKLKTIRAIGLRAEPFLWMPWKVLQMLKRRAAHEKASEMREHPETIRYALLGCFLHVRAMEVTDDATRMAIDLIHRLDTRSEKQIHRELLADLERVEGKMQILSRVAEVVVEYPGGIVREVIFPQVKEETFRHLVAEFRHSGPHLRLLRQTIMQRKFARHYRRMLPALLDGLPFRSENRFRPIIEALAMIQRYVGTRATYFPEAVPLEGVVSPKWKEKVCAEVKGELRVHRHYYELCVLEKLQRALKCKEVWVEGAYTFRNPNEDLPGDWGDEQRRALHYRDLGQPLEAQSFVSSLKARLAAALAVFNRSLPQLSHVRLFRPNRKEERSLWALAKLEPQAEPQGLGVLKDAIRRRYGMLDLLDVLVEADSLVDFTHFK